MYFFEVNISYADDIVNANENIEQNEQEDIKQENLEQEDIDLSTYRPCIINIDKDQGCYSRVYSPNGNLIFEGVYKKFLKQGIHKLYLHNRLTSVDHYNNGILNGLSKQYNRSGQLSSVKYYKNGLLDGEAKRFNIHGKMTILANYKDGQLHGNYFRYYNNGSIHRKLQYKNDDLKSIEVFAEDGSQIFPLKKCKNFQDFLDGCSHYKYDFSKRLSFIITFKNAKRNGYAVKLNTRGNIIYEYHYNDNILDIDPIFYNRYNSHIEKNNKKLLSKECSSTQDIIDGCTSFDYYNNNVLKSVVSFKDGELNGKSTLYTENGNISRSVNLVKGVVDGPFIRYHLDKENNKFEEINFIDGIKQGIYKVYYKSGALHIKGNFYNDLLQGIDKEYYENGDLKVLCNYKEGWKDGHEITYYQNGQIEKEVFFEHGIRKGLFREYFINGQIRVEGKYDNDKLSGPLIEYYDNGNIKYKKNLNRGLIDGDLLFYDEDGFLIEKTTFKLGKMHGNRVFYKKNSFNFITLEYNNGSLISAKCSNGYVFNEANLHNYQYNVRALRCKESNKEDKK